MTSEEAPRPASPAKKAARVATPPERLRDVELGWSYNVIPCGDLELREYDGLATKHGGSCWVASHVLALSLSRHYHKLLDRAVVVDLSSGCGAAGLARGRRRVRNSQLQTAPLSVGRFPLVSADFWTSDHRSERCRSANVVSGTRARGTATSS